MKLIVYSLRTINDKTMLSIDLTGRAIFETHYQIKFNLQSGTVYLPVKEYLNKMKVYDDGDVFFIVCTKKVSRESALKCLLNYAMDKVTDTLDNLNARVERLNNFKTRLQSEMVAA